MIGYYGNAREKSRGVASKNKKIRERVDSEVKYGRWKLRVMGSSEWGMRNEMGNRKWVVNLFLC